MSDTDTEPSGKPALGADRLERGEGWRRTSPLGVATQGLRGVQQAILPTVAIMFGTRSADIWIAIAVGMGIVLLNLLITTISWRNTQYRIGSNDVRLQRGVLGREARSVPFERIQDVSLEETPLARIFGLVEVRFETGAGGKDELKLSYLSREEGQALRETVRARIDLDAPAENMTRSPADATISAARESDTPLFTMGTRRILVFGLFEFSLILFAVLAGAAQQLDFLLPFDIWDFDEWEERLAGPGAWLFGLGPATRLIGAVIAIAGLAVIGSVTGIARTFAREYGFRLDRTAKGFRRRRGLFTRTDVVMPVHRVQAITVSTGLLRRRWGWHGLAFISLAQDAGSASHQVAPFARMDEIAPVASAAGFTLPQGETCWHQPSRRYRSDRALLSGAPPLVVALVVMAAGLPLLGALALSFAGLMGVRQYLLWRFERHALDDRQVLSRKGWLAPRLTVAARQKLHSVTLIQGPIARRRGYADLRFGLAGGSLSFNGLPLEQARHLRTAVLVSIAAVDFSDLPH